MTRGHNATGMPEGGGKVMEGVSGCVLRGYGWWAELMENVFGPASDAGGLPLWQ